MKTDHILIFFTKNAKTIDMSEIANHGSAELSMIEVSAGKQSTDIHIGSYLGYLAGKYGSNCKIVIVSKDTDFDKVIKFWKTKSNMNVSRLPAIKGAVKKAEKAEKKAAPETAGKQPAKAAPNEKTALNAMVMQSLSKAGYTNDVTTGAASIVVRNYAAKNGKQQTYRGIISKFGQGKGLAIYRVIKNLL